MGKTYLYQNRVIFVWMLILILIVSVSYLKKKIDYVGYVELART